MEIAAILSAASRLFVTPSAMSKTLHRLREALNDPLLVRGTGGLVPTPRAEELAVLLKRAFSDIDNCYKPATFNPAVACSRLRIAAPETFAIGTIPSLLPVLQSAAPKLLIESLHLECGYLDSLANGTLDFIVSLDGEDPEGCITWPLFKAGPKIWCRRDHPVTRLRRLNLEDICKYPKVAFHSPGTKPVGLQNFLKALEELELGREVLRETSHLLLALVMLSQSDALMLGADYLFHYPMFGHEIVSLSVQHIGMFDPLSLDICLIQVAAEAVRAFTRQVPGAKPVRTTPDLRHIRLV